MTPRSPEIPHDRTSAPPAQLHRDRRRYGRCHHHDDARGPRGRLLHAVGSTASEDPDSVEGPVAKIVAVIIIVVTGLTLAFGDSSGGFRRLIQIVFGLSIAFAASSFFLSFFSFGGGALL